MKRYESTVRGYEGHEIFFQVWEHAKPVADLIITHGQGEHSGCYQRTADALKNLPLRIIAWDLRGHGRSEGLRGYVDDFQEYVEDFKALLLSLKEKNHLTQKPLYLLGHSMGGLVQLRYLIGKDILPVQAQILSSPMMGVSMPVPFVKELGALALHFAWPKLTMHNQIKHSQLSRDPEVHKEYDLDVLRHHQINSRAYFGHIIASQEIMKAASKIRVPTLMMSPENDPVVSTPKNLSLFEALGSPDKELKQYLDRCHEIFNDLDRESVFDDLKSFLSNLLGLHEKS